MDNEEKTTDEIKDTQPVNNGNGPKKPKRKNLLIIFVSSANPQKQYFKKILS